MGQLVFAIGMSEFYLKRTWREIFLSGIDLRDSLKGMECYNRAV